LTFDYEIFVVIQPSSCLNTEQQSCLIFEQFLSIFEHELNKYWKTGVDDMILDGVVINGFTTPEMWDLSKMF
jgi:hypothetical protein